MRASTSDGVLRRRLLVLAVVASVFAVAASWFLTVVTNRLFLPVLFGLGDEPLSLLFLLLPAACTAVVGVQGRSSRRFLALAAGLGTATTLVLGLAVWFAWLMVVCHGGGCYD
jgi:ABC-type enterochelin transport system permease subunit